MRVVIALCIVELHLRINVSVLCAVNKSRPNLCNAVFCELYCRAFRVLPLVPLQHF